MELHDKVEYLKELLAQRSTRMHTAEEDSVYKALRQSLLADEHIGHLIPEFVAGCRNLYEFWGIIKEASETYSGRREFLRQAFDPLLSHLEGRAPSPGAGLPPVGTTAVKQDNGNAGQGNKVFIVHGRDDTMREATARLVLQLGLQPILLSEELDKGRTIIQKFEDAAGEAVFAIVLLTPDDVGRLTSEDNGNLKSRARQNVILELGYFLAKLGPGRVCAVYKDGVELPSDVAGRLYKPYDAAGRWKFDVAREMKGAEIPVDLNRL